MSQRRLTYDAIGTTLDDAGWPPSGYRTNEATTRVGEGHDYWEFVRDAVMRWGIKTRSGFTVDAANLTELVTVGARYWLVASVGRIRVHEPVEVVRVVDEEDRRGFAYGTLSGHPLSGEEAFTVERRADGSSWLTIRSIVRPGDGVWRLAYAGVLAAQPVYRRRYLRALALPQ